MYLKSLRLRDWKSYVEAEFEFPLPEVGRNVVLIGANNGYGKTSFLEALLAGIYGRDAMPLLARAAGDSSGDPDRSWKSFLERAFYARALDEGRNSMSISVTLDDDWQGPTTIERVWYFRPNGQFKEESITIYTGTERALLLPPPLDSEREDWYRGAIVQRFLPSHMAQFFLFDGEQVQRLAKKTMREQIRSGLEDVLGVGTVRLLQNDLKLYISQRSQGTRTIDSENLTRLRDSILQDEQEIALMQGREAEATTLLNSLTTEREQTEKELFALMPGTIANLKELHERRANLLRDRERRIQKLQNLMQNELALALCGRELLAKTQKRVEQEQLRRNWEQTRHSTLGKLEVLQTRLETLTAGIDPPLSPVQQLTLRDALSRAWEGLWHPEPPGCAQEYRHPYLSERDATLLLEKLLSLHRLRSGGLEEDIRFLSQVDHELRACEEQITRIASVEERALELQGRNEALRKKEGEQKEVLRGLQSQVRATQGRLDANRASLGRLEQDLHKAGPQLRKNQLAQTVVELLDELVTDSFPLYVGDMARRMTETYKKLAHKKTLDRIEIEPDCTVRLLARNGVELRSFDSSAGEDQIFALALISAISEIAERSFPVVIDTPLARLDTLHRTNVLRHFTDRGAEQVIFLSTPEEITGRFYDQVSSMVCATWLLEHQDLGNGVGRNRVRFGRYFN